jgi:hypothetical protein
MQASKKRLVEAYDEQSERKRALKKTEQVSIRQHTSAYVSSCTFCSYVC